ncbi:MAG: hypothetical protein N3A54_06530, partial [Patescibacteria group bacterium]|nr:hypothetical protein [Patescibacteria group bacterium]
ILKNNLLRARQDNDVFHMGTYHDSVSLFMMPQIVFVKLPLPFILLILLGVWGLVFRDRVLVVTQWLARYRSNGSSQHQHEQDDPVLYRSVPQYKLRFRHEGRIDTEWTYVFVIPVVAIFFSAILFRMTPLVRYVLPAFPFFALIVGSVFAGFRSRWKYGLLVVCIVWMAWGVYRSHPHYIAFTNEFIPAHVRFLYLVDSNLDWGQGLVSLRQYIEKNQPRSALLSYFGRDDAALYGFVSDKAWGSYKNDEICAFHTIDYPSNAGEPLTVISVTNWRECGYDQQQLYTKDNIRDIVGDSFLIF